jgi:hypothetical protein
MDRWVHLQDVMVDPVVAGFHGWLEYQEFGFAMAADRSL